MNIFSSLQEDFRVFSVMCQSNAFTQEDIKWYQENYRFYLDEFQGQEELRKEWFKNRKNSFLTKRFLERL